MATLAQHKANKKNAQLSTGPKTEVGRQRSSLNAVKHGVFAKHLFVNEDDGALADYETLQEGILDSLRPRDAFQSVLVEKIVVDLWRLKKVLAFERGASQLELLALDDCLSPWKGFGRDPLESELKKANDSRKALNELQGFVRQSACSCPPLHRKPF
jgi:hypothetical protein